MAGRPLEEAKKVMEISASKTTDKVGIVTYGHTTDVVISLANVEDSQRIRVSVVFMLVV